MVMSIKDFTQNYKNNSDEIVYAASIKRSFASGIDMLLVLLLRSIVIQIIGIAYLDRVWRGFFLEFYNKFGTQTVKKTPEHIYFVTHHQVFYITLLSIIIVIIVGAFYHAYLNSSSWQATVGKRVMKIIMVKEPYNSRLSFSLAFWHYFLSILPFVFIAYLINYQISHDLTFFQVITASNFNLFLGFVFIAWVQIHLFTKKKTTAYDLICKTVLMDGKTTAKFPWDNKNGYQNNN